jgi:pimeloyl-ACP methyl ester carboxylesterase
MSGDRDFFYDAGDVSATAAAIPDGEVVLFRRQGHGLPRTRAEEVFQHTLAYLKEHRA